MHLPIHMHTYRATYVFSPPLPSYLLNIYLEPSLGVHHRLAKRKMNKNAQRLALLHRHLNFARQHQKWKWQSRVTWQQCALRATRPVTLARQHEDDSHPLLMHRHVPGGSRLLNATHLPGLPNFFFKDKAKNHEALKLAFFFFFYYYRFPGSQFWQNWQVTSKEFVTAMPFAVGGRLSSRESRINLGKTKKIKPTQCRYLFSPRGKKVQERHHLVRRKWYITNNL